MKKKQIADGVRLLMNANGQDTSVQLDERTIFWLADTIRVKLISKYIERFGKESVGAFTKGYVLPVQKDTTRDLKYVKVVDGLISVEGNNGVVSISKTQGTECAFVLVKAGQESIYSNLEAECAGGSVLYWQENNIVYFSKLGFEVEEVLVRAIPSLDSIEFDEQVPIPTDLELDMIQGIVALIVPKAEDKQNNGNENKPTING